MKADVPRHVAIIPDGNRRWAKKQSLKDLMRGHWAGASNLTKIVEAASDMGIKVLTVYSFSTENWQRPKIETNTLFNIFERYLRENRPKMVSEGVRFHTIGDLSPFPDKLKKEIATSREQTANGTTLDLVLAMNYGARDEIKRAMISMGRAVQKGELDPRKICEKMIASHLDTHPFGDPDLLIRTSGELRVSNFLLWQLAYTEMYVTDVLWPDFTSRDLLDAVLDFQKRNRRLGK